MRAFMTNGTLDFLLKVDNAHKALDFHFMYNGEGTLLYYEAEGKSVFGAGRTLEIILTNGKIKKTGYVVMIHIPLTAEGIPIFVDRFRREMKEIRSMKGLQAFRLLKARKGNTYIIFSQWASKTDFKRWESSEDFILFNRNHDFKQPAYFAARPFSVSYIMIDEAEFIEES